MAENQKHSDNIEKWLRLTNTKGVGPVAVKKLLDYFGDIDHIIDASVKGLMKVNGIGEKTAESILRGSNNFDTQKEIDLADKLKVRIISIEDPDYPAPLKKIFDSPPVLYVKGTLCRQDNLSLAIVGSRRCSLYGTEQANRFAHLLAGSGFTIISGMARGIDTAAHTGALSADGRTIAVQGCGLKNIFPPENAKLFEKIAENGACISELPLEYEPLAENFPARNRIIAGLSLATLVIEASNKSGAMLTAAAALENNREVMAIPGKIDSPLNQGTHRLIKQGARLVDCIEDIMEALGYIGDGLKSHCLQTQEEITKDAQKSLFNTENLKLTENEKIILDKLRNDSAHIEDIILTTKLTAGIVNSTLMSLRLKGLVKHHPGNIFSKNI